MSSRYRSIVALLDDPKNLACVIRELMRREGRLVHFDDDIVWEIFFKISLYYDDEEESQRLEKPWDPDDEDSFPLDIDALRMKINVEEPHEEEAAEVRRSSGSRATSGKVTQGRQQSGQGEVVSSVRQFIDRLKGKT